MAKQYGIIVKAHADLKDFQDELRTKIKQEEQKTKIDIKIEADEKALDKVHEKFNVIQKDYELIDRKIKTGLELKVKDEASGKLKSIKKNVDVVIDTYKNLDGTVQKMESVLWHHGSVTEVLSQKILSVSKSSKELNSTLKSSSEVTERIVNKYKSLTGVLHTITEEHLANGNRMRTFVSEYEKDGQKIREVSKKVSIDGGKHWKKYGEDLKEVINDETKLAEAHKKVQQVYSETNTYRRTDGAIVNRTYSKDSDGTEHQKLIIQYEDEKGRKVQEVTELIKLQGEGWKQNGETSKTVINDEIAQEDKLAQSIQKVYEETVKYRNAQGQTVTRTNITDSDGTKHHLITKEYEDNLGRKIQEVTEYIKLQGKGWQKVGETSKKVLDDEIQREEELRKKEQKLREEEEKRLKLNIYTTDYKGKVKEVLDLKDKTIHKLQTETKEIKNGLNETTKVTTETDKWVDAQGMLHTKLTETTQDFDRYGKAVKDATTKVTENVEKSKTGLNQLGQSFSDIIVKVAKFYLASLPIRAMQTAITNAVQSVKDFDSALTEFKKVSDLSGKSLENYTEKLEQLGKLTARTRTEMVEMATEFKRSGFDDNDAAILAQTAS